MSCNKKGSTATGIAGIKDCLVFNFEEAFDLSVAGLEIEILESALLCLSIGVLILARYH